jgi:hypothetical protein
MTPPNRKQHQAQHQVVTASTRSIIAAADVDVADTRVKDEEVSGAGAAEVREGTSVAAEAVVAETSEALGVASVVLPVVVSLRQLPEQLGPADLVR